MRLMQIEDRQISTGLAQLLASKEQRGKTRRIEFAQVVEIQSYTNIPRL